jgi:hypothetical protein
MLALKFGNQTWNGLEGMWVRDDDDGGDDDDDDTNFVIDPNVHLGRVHSITDKAILVARQQWKAQIEALVDDN